LDQQTTVSLATVEVVITDLPDAVLGLAKHNTIYLDRDAARRFVHEPDSGRRRAIRENQL
jgi:hypothetical protein